MSNDEPDLPDEEELDADEIAERERVRQESEKRQHREEAKLFWTQVFAHPIGRREMWGVLQSAHAFEERFACSPTGFPDPNATWFHAGEQALGLRLFMSWQVMAPEGVFAMQMEHDHRFPKPPPHNSERGPS